MIGTVKVTGAMMELQDNSNTSKEIYNDLEVHVCTFHRSKRVTNINHLLYSKFKGKKSQEKKYVDLNTVPTCRRSLHMHIKHANRAVYMMK